MLKAFGRGQAQAMHTTHQLQTKRLQADSQHFLETADHEKKTKRFWKLLAGFDGELPVEVEITNTSYPVDQVTP